MPLRPGFDVERFNRLLDNPPTLVSEGRSFPLDICYIGRDAAVMQGPHGLTMKGKAAWLSWGAVHLALLSTGEDRAKAVIDWTWARFTHERSARITVRTDTK